MTNDFDVNRPIYLQLVERIGLNIAAGGLKPGDKLNSVRDLAGEYNVNPNTMQRALAELEKSGLVYSQRTSGRFVTDNPEIIRKVRNDMATELIANLVNNLLQLAYNKDEILEIMQSYLKELE